MTRAALAGALAVLAVLAPGASALSFKSCAPGSFVQCAVLPVPIDRSGEFVSPTVTIPLHIQRIRALDATEPPLVLVTGGPGQEGTALVADGIPGGPFPADLLGRDVIAFDPRGTGSSGLLRCPALEKAIIKPQPDAEAQACWSSLGPARFSYTSRTVADDIDAIRQALGVPKIALYGISYGTSEVQTYARVYPQNVDRLILDSTVPPGGGDGLERQSFGAIARVLHALCVGSRCRAVTSDPVADMAKLIASIPASGLVGPIVTEGGHRRRQRAGRYELFDLLLNGDFDGTLRGSLPAAVRSALAGDTAPLMRLVHASLESDVADFDHPRELSTADFAATVCQEVPFPWSRTAPTDQRATAVAQAAAATPPSSLAPFDQQTLLSPQIVEPCLAWPQSAQPPDLGSADPDVPVLILSGEADLRTPLEQARLVAARFPRAILRTFPYAGHDVIDGLSGPICAWRLAQQFLLSSTVGNCTAREFAPSIAPVAPRKLRDVTPLRRPGGTAGRVLSAVGLTIDDVFDSPGDPVVPALRSGRAVLGANDLRLERDVYVPGVRVDGRLTASGAALSGTLRIGGTLRGTLHVKRNRITGRLGGRRVRARLQIGGGHLRAVAAARAATAGIRDSERRFPRPR